jgi:hypothetical protein
MDKDTRPGDLTRRQLLLLGGAAGAAAGLGVASPAAGQTPRRGGIFRLRGDDPVGFDLTEMIRLQRRTFDATKRRDILYDIQRYLAQQVYHLYGPSVLSVVAWEPYVRNFGANFGSDQGGRLMAAWLER